MVKLRNSVWNIRRSSRFIRCWLLIHAWRTAHSPVSTFLPHFVRRFTPTNMQCDYFASRHVSAACLRAVLVVIIDARSFRYHRGVISMVTVRAHVCRALCPTSCLRHEPSRIHHVSSQTASMPVEPPWGQTWSLERLFRSNFVCKNRLELVPADNRCCICHLDLASLRFEICSKGRRSLKKHKFNVPRKS